MQFPMGQFACRSKILARANVMGAVVCEPASVTAFGAEHDQFVELRCIANDPRRVNDGEAERNQARNPAAAGLGFVRSDFNRPVSEFGSGWKMRVELAKILLQKVAKCNIKYFRDWAGRLLADLK